MKGIVPSFYGESGWGNNDWSEVTDRLSLPFFTFDGYLETTESFVSRLVLRCVQDDMVSLAEVYWRCINIRSHCRPESQSVICHRLGPVHAGWKLSSRSIDCKVVRTGFSKRRWYRICEKWQTWLKKISIRIDLSCWCPHNAYHSSLRFSVQWSIFLHNSSWIKWWNDDCSGSVFGEESSTCAVRCSSTPHASPKASTGGAAMTECVPSAAYVQAPATEHVATAWCSELRIWRNIQWRTGSG